MSPPGSPNSTPKTTKQKLGAGLSSLHHTTKRLLGFEKKIFHSIEDFEEMVERLIEFPHTNAHKASLKGSYANIYRRYQDLIEEEKLINRMERKAHIRNTFFRGVTTLVIGFSIMGVYWVASCLKIAMPLMKLPV